jgi:hypothetical protein
MEVSSLLWILGTICVLLLATVFIIIITDKPIKNEKKHN